MAPAPLFVAQHGEDLTVVFDLGTWCEGRWWCHQNDIPNSCHAPGVAIAVVSAFQVQVITTRSALPK